MRELEISVRKTLVVVYHLQKVSGKSGQKVNGTGLFGSFQRENFRERRNIWNSLWPLAPPLGKARAKRAGRQSGLWRENSSALSKPFYSGPFLAIFSTQGSLVPGYFWKGGPFFPNRLFQMGKSCSIFIKAIFDIPVLGLHGRFSVDGTDLYTRGKRDSWTKFWIFLILLTIYLNREPTGLHV